MAVIELEDVRKTFVVARASGGVLGRLRPARTEVKAVDSVSLRIEAGEMVGYVGPNGAGKSTTVKMLTGVLMPSGGRLSVVGLDPVRRRIEVARRIGVVFGQRTQLWWDLPLRDSFELLRHLYRVPAATYAKNLAVFNELLDLEPFWETPVRQLSLGQRMRGDLAAALLHDPEILFLDEPTIGLDVVAKARVRDFLQTVNRERGTTVLLTTHDTTDIERLCPRVVVIDHGHVIFDGRLAELRSRVGGESVLVIDLVDPGPPLEVAGARVIKVDGPRQWLSFRRDDISAPDLIATVASRVRLRDLTVTEPDIEDVVRRIYERGLQQP